MLSIALIGGGRLDYYVKLAQEDYYTQALEPPGHWFGLGAERLGLRGEVRPEQYRAVLQGFTPDGKRSLVQNAGQQHRQCGWDLTFCAPKSVSVLWALGTPEVRATVEAAHAQAVANSLAFVQEHCSETRRGPGGSIREPALLSFARFDHSTSRTLDPHLHTHVLMLNLGVRQDGTTGTLRSHPVFSAKMTLGMVYRTELAAQLRQQLALTLEPERVGFHVRGIPRELCRAFSRRRQAIERHLQEHGRTGAVAAKAATLATRPKKRAASREELHVQWELRAQTLGWSAQRIRRQTQRRTRLRTHVSQKRFTWEAQQAATQLSPEERRGGSLLKALSQLAYQRGADSQTVLDALTSVHQKYRVEDPRWLRVQWHRLFDPTPWKPPQKRWLRTEWQSAFPLSPLKSLRKIKLPVLAVELPRLAIGSQRFRPRWWSIRWKRDLFLAELRVQQRVLFPKAPKWSPFYGLSLPALRLTRHKSKWRPREQSEPIQHNQSH